MSLQNHPSKANMVADSLSRLSMRSLAHMDKEKWELVKNTHCLANLEVHLLDTENGGVIIQEVAQSSLGAEIKEIYMLDPILMRIKGDIVGQKVMAFEISGDSTLRYQGRLCVLDKGLGTKVNLSAVFYPQLDGKMERIIQMLEDMLCSCVSSWVEHLPLIEFAYNNKYHSSIGMAPFEALYGRSYRSLIGWFEVGEAKMFGLDLVHQAMEKVKVSPIKGVMQFGKKGKLIPRSVWVIEIHSPGVSSQTMPIKDIDILDSLSYEEILIEILDWLYGLVIGRWVGIVASTVIDSTPFCIFTIDSILLRIELFRKAPSSTPEPASETSPAPAPDESAPIVDASSPTLMMSHPASPTSSPIGDPKDGLVADSENSTIDDERLGEDSSSANVDENKANAVNKIPHVPIHHPIIKFGSFLGCMILSRCLAVKFKKLELKIDVYPQITKPPVPVAPIRNEIEDCIIIDAEDYKATGYSDVPIFVQHTEVIMEEIDRMGEEIEIKDAEYWSVMDIDSSDKKNELDVLEYIDDIYAYNKKVEITACVPPNYMEQQFDINERIRGILIDWIIEVDYKFKLMEETLYLTMNLIDRFLAIQLVIRKKLQLVGITALLLACKFEEVFVPVVEDLILISDKAYARREGMLEIDGFFPSEGSSWEAYWRAPKVEQV
ncbi:Cyclin-B2-4 [Capsicum annuum]|nr:Cyclin-B2-4 [Capsicum annuum]